jgi:Domain of unknown function (DUF4062)
VKDEADLFVGIYAHRYGFIPEGSEVSISELEYKTAVENSLPKFIYIIDESQPWIPGLMDEGAKKKKLNAFKASLLKSHICQKFENKDQLAAKVAADLGRHIAMQSIARVGGDVVVPDIGVESLRGGVSETPDEWNKRRNTIYDLQRGIFLTHVIRPSSKPGQTFDVYIYLLRHKSDDLSDVRVADFFLGKYWDNRVFSAVLKDGFVGISTSAYGTFLCTCRVTFKDGSSIDIQRYIDFESQRTGGSGT